MARPKPIHEQLHKRKGHLLIDNVMVPKDKIMACYLSDSILTFLECDDFGKLMIDKYLLWDVRDTYSRLCNLIRQMPLATSGDRAWKLVNNFFVLLYYKGFNVEMRGLPPEQIIYVFTHNGFYIEGKSFIYRQAMYGRGASASHMTYDDDWYIHHLYMHYEELATYIRR